MKDHSRNALTYQTGLRIQPCEGLEALKIYYTIGRSVSSLHRERESTDFSDVYTFPNTCHRVYT